MPDTYIQQPSWFVAPGVSQSFLSPRYCVVGVDGGVPLPGHSAFSRSPVPSKPPNPAGPPNGETDGDATMFRIWTVFLDTGCPLNDTWDSTSMARVHAPSLGRLPWNLPLPILGCFPGLIQTAGSLAAVLGDS